MSDRYNALIITLETDMKDEDAEQLMRAIWLLRGVINVTPHVADIGARVAQDRARWELIEKLKMLLLPG